jgi:hypothetical protein
MQINEIRATQTNNIVCELFPLKTAHKNILGLLASDCALITQVNFSTLKISQHFFTI